MQPSLLSFRAAVFSHYTALPLQFLFRKRVDEKRDTTEGWKGIIVPSRPVTEGGWKIETRGTPFGREIRVIVPGYLQSSTSEGNFFLSLFSFSDSSVREKYLSPDLIVTCLLARFDHGMEKVWKKFGKIYRDPSVRANPCEPSPQFLSSPPRAGGNKSGRSGSEFRVFGEGKKGYADRGELRSSGSLRFFTE